jgi:ribosomal protein L3 glutamine methyltransferase
MAQILMTPDHLTLEQCIRDAAGQMEAAGLYFGHGTDNAIDEACWLASAALGLPPDFGNEEFSRVLSAVEQDRLNDLLRQRIETRKPLAYLIGEAWLAGLKFTVNESVLVPRSPLAELIIDGFEPWLAAPDLARAVDIGTGSGCLAIALARHWPEVRVDALDISEKALELARRNAIDHGVADRVNCLRSDLLDGVPGQRYDLILANPPYVPSASMQDLPAEFRHEPVLGLEAGADGLDLVRRLLVSAPNHLEDHGILICEVGEAAEALQNLLGQQLELIWLEFAHGGDGVFILDKPAAEAAARLIREST